jgi:hypothetical protein
LERNDYRPHFRHRPKGYLLIPNGKLTIDRDQKFTVEGASRTVITEGSHRSR